MTNRNTKGGLVAFAKGECANWIAGHGYCVRQGDCLIAKGRPCGYFEQVVLGPPDYKYHLPGSDYQELFEQYARINSAYQTKQVSIRRCECGMELKPRQRCCEKCRRRRRQKTNRENQRKWYLRRRAS